MELSEATTLSDTFITSLIFNLHSVPLNERAAHAVSWWREQGSRIPLRAAIKEKHRHSMLFSSYRESERRREREIFISISAIVDDYGGGTCPSLKDARCGIYERRPLTCRTVPLHYSRPPSALLAYLDQFTSTPGYECETTTAPVILDGNTIVAPEIKADRGHAVVLAKADRPWKEQMLSLMGGQESADRAGLPSIDNIYDNFENGYATFVPMIVAWNIAKDSGLISAMTFGEICRRQVALIKGEIKRSPSTTFLTDLLALYQAGTIR